MTLAKALNQLNKGSNGHLPGFYMAYLLLRNGYGSQLLDHVDDPFAFVQLYQRAARRDHDHRRPPVFSATTMRYLKELSHKYSRKKAVPAKA
ncbi:MAG: DUF5700 domain-containing putative Zn-dependent protease [Janthinobacterium lividum]